LNSSCSISVAGFAAPNRKPCTSLHPSAPVELIDGFHTLGRDGEFITASAATSVVQQANDPIEGLRALVRAYAGWLTDPTGTPRRRVGVNGWAEALRSQRVHARVVEGIRIPRSIIVGLVEEAQRMNVVSRDLSADAIARSLIALFQGFVLQVTWGEDIDVDSCIAVVDRMLLGLGQKGKN
jgi:BetI-type transcriptional repressor, C-terminal